MICRCDSPKCIGVVEIGHCGPRFYADLIRLAPCSTCGRFHKWGWGLAHRNTVHDGDNYYRYLALPMWKVGTRFGRIITVPTGFTHRKHTKTQRKRRVSRRKKNRHGRKGRVPRG